MDKTKKPMPDWMMRYVSNIGTEECYLKFRELSKEYYIEIGDPDDSNGNLKKPAQKLDLMKVNRVFNNPTPRNPQPDDPDFVITEKYKREARHLAHNLGYGDIKLLEIWKENDPSVDDVRKNASREDKIANSAHREFVEKYPEKAARSKDVERSYRNLETQEYNGKFHQAKNSKKFEKTQDKFQENIFNARSKSDQPTEDDKDPDPNGTGGRSKSSDFKDNSTNKRCEKFLDNSFDISSNRMLKTYFESRGMNQEMLDDLTSRDSGYTEKMVGKSKDSKENQTKNESEKPSMVDIYFKKHGVVINKDGDEMPTFGKTISNDNFSITYTKQASGGDSKKKSRDMDKE